MKILTLFQTNPKVSLTLYGSLKETNDWGSYIQWEGYCKVSLDALEVGGVNKAIEIGNARTDGFHSHKVIGEYSPAYTYGIAKTHKRNIPLLPIIS